MSRGNYGNNGSNQQNMSQLANDLNNLGLDPSTLKKLSMSGIREFIPTPSSSSGEQNSGSSSPFMGQQRLQPPTIGSYGSPRTSPTPSSTNLMPSQDQAAAQGQDPGISTYVSDGGTTYFYSSDEMVKVFLVCF